MFLHVILVALEMSGRVTMFFNRRGNTLDVWFGDPYTETEYFLQIYYLIGNI